MSISEHTFGDPHPGTGGDTSKAAARLLEKTAQETDQWRAEARSEAAGIVAGARDEAAGLVRSAREEAERLLSAARDEAQKTVDEARAEAYRVREDTAAVRKRHEEDVAHLQQVAGDHRERLRQHLSEMLDRVESIPGAGEQ
jgi:cell division septum initiation protein DivIVA